MGQRPAEVCWYACRTCACLCTCVHVCVTSDSYFKQSWRQKLSSFVYGFALGSNLIEKSCQNWRNFRQLICKVQIRTCVKFYFVSYLYLNNYFVSFGWSALTTLISTYVALTTVRGLRAYRVTHDTWPALVRNSGSDIWNVERWSWSFFWAQEQSLAKGRKS